MPVDSMSCVVYDGPFLSTGSYVNAGCNSSHAKCNVRIRNCSVAYMSVLQDRVYYCSSRKILMLYAVYLSVVFFYVYRMYNPNHTNVKGQIPMGSITLHPGNTVNYIHNTIHVYPCKRYKCFVTYFVLCVFSKNLTLSGF